jgi:hypothetical protein
MVMRRGKVVSNIELWDLLTDAVSYIGSYVSDGEEYDIEIPQGAMVYDTRFMSTAEEIMELFCFLGCAEKVPNTGGRFFFVYGNRLSDVEYS